MKKLAVIGENVSSYSLSPLIHNRWFDHYEIDAEYRAIDLKKTDLEKFIPKIKSDYLGVNITTPYKTSLIQYLDHIDELAKEIYAINLIVNIDSKLYGFNTDIDGLKSLLNFKKIHDKVLIFGSGGAARAAAYCLNNFFFTREIIIVSRNKNQFSPKLNLDCKISFIDYNDESINEYFGCDLVINATPYNVCPINISKSKQTIFVDLNYFSTPFQDQIKNFNCKLFSGKEMFIVQAQKCFEKWFGIFPSKELVENLL